MIGGKRGRKERGGGDGLSKQIRGGKGGGAGGWSTVFRGKFVRNINHNNKQKKKGRKEGKRDVKRLRNTKEVDKKKPITSLHSETQWAVTERN